MLHTKRCISTCDTEKLGRSLLLDDAIGLVIIMHSLFTEIDVQLVGLVKTLIDPENIMTDAAAVVSHMTIT